MKIKMTTFTKWFLLNAVILTSLFLVEQKGFISLIVKNDLSHISILIMGLYLCVSLYVGRLCYLSDHMSEKSAAKRKKEKALKKQLSFLLFLFLLVFLL